MTFTRARALLLFTCCLAFLSGGALHSVVTRAYHWERTWLALPLCKPLNVHHSLYCTSAESAAGSSSHACK